MKTINSLRLAAAFGLVLCTRSLLPGATFPVTSTANSGNGTLRQAILNANTNADLDTIMFNITMGGSGVKTITPTSALPPITSPVIIDGTTQPGYTGVTPFIELNGTNAPAAIGLDLRGGSSLIRALTINRFHFPGIVIQTNGNNVIEGCFIGTDSSGTIARGNGIASISDGIAIIDSSGNLIGGTSPFAGNVISGNGRHGIGLIGSLSQSNRIEANVIGADLNGTNAIPNRDGIGILDAPGNTIGGPNIFFLNVISGNTEQGIAIVGAHAVGNSVEGNYIGLDASGLAPLPNGRNGILISTTTLPEFPGPASANRIGGNGTGNTISGNGHDGIQMGFGTTSNQVTGNFVGLNENGSGLVPNGRHGVSIFDSTNNSIIAMEGDFNRIVGNNSNGVFIGRGALNAGSVSNRIEGNLIATNGLDGVQLSGGANGNQILGNIIGGIISSDGTPILGNARHGVAIFDSTNNVIGGSLADTWNNISGNRSNGVFLGKGVLASGSYSNTVQGNQIGNNVMGNGGAGIFVEGSRNLIGGYGDHDGNRIGFNGTNLLQRGHGVVISSGTNNAILGNVFRSNAGRAIDLGNDSFTVNDIGDTDTGANDLQNYPVVTRVAFHRQAGFKEITWTLNSRPLRYYYIEAFGNSEADPSGFGEGEVRLTSRLVLTDNNGMAVFTLLFPMTDAFISATATDAVDRNTSEFSPVDTDGDAIADAWEIRGIDYNEDGTIDLVLTNAHPEHKDIYVEIDSMLGRAPDMGNLGRVNLGSGLRPVLDVASGEFVFELDLTAPSDGFFDAPAHLVQNQNGDPGIAVHLHLDETYLPFAAWGSSDMSFLYVLKTNFFGTISQRASTNALEAKKLVYHYCLFADSVPDAAGRGELPGNDFYLALGERSPEDDFVPTAFMHELGHNLGLSHGGVDGINFKPNYHSVMNYAWLSSRGANSPWQLDFSREDFGLLDEGRLDEGLGIGASTNHAGHMVLIGPYFVGDVPVIPKLVPEIGPVDWNDNGTNIDIDVQRDLDYVSGITPSPDNILSPSEDWSKLRFYFLDTPGGALNIPPDELTNDLSPSILEAYEKLGTGTGHLQFSAPFYRVNETGATAVISVTRVFEVEANVSVSFSTFNGTATSGLDYAATNGVLSFSGSESLKTFTVPILNDGTAEEPETIQLLLSSPTGGATLGTRKQATLTIIDNDPPGHFTVLNTNNSGAGSLRQAILDANASPGIGIIDFNIPGPSGLTISPTTALPTITNFVTLDGTTQPGYAGVPIIELNGASAGSASGLSISAGRCTVRGLVINRFAFSGINLASLTLAGQNRIEGCYIGLNRQGTLDQGNGANGINVPTPNNVIGGLTLAARNYISGNNGSGIEVSGVATNTQILGNVIGLGVDGSDQGNSFSGVNIVSSQNTIGGIEEGARNVISGNGIEGVNLGAGVQNRVLGNFIGTDLAGLAARGNSSNGISAGTIGHIIGGDKVGAGNVISGNGRRGIAIGGAAMVVLGNKIGTDVTGQNAIANQQGGVLLSFSSQSNQIVSTAPFAGNTIAFNNGPGVFVSSASASNNVIRGNSIHSHPSSFLGIDLFEAGISLNDTNDTDIGANQLQNHPVLFSASNSLAGTFIQGRLNSRPNTNYTIDFYASVAPDPSGWGEGQSWIGSTTVTTGSDGNAEFSAQTPAIYVKGQFITATATDATGNTSEFSPAVVAGSTIPGRTFTVLNVNDSGDGSLRQAILDANAYRSERDTIEFDIPGSGVQTITPLSALPDITDPVLIDGYTQTGASPNTALTGHNGVLRIELDGSLVATPGLIVLSGNSIIRGLAINRFASAIFGRNGGIELRDLGGNQVEGNFIGTDPTGTLDRGNLRAGISIQNSSTNVVGGVLPGQRNVISGTDHVVSGGISPGNGIAMNNTFGNRIEGNLIGTAADGVSPLRNDSFGIEIAGGSHVIGGTLPGSGNVIAFNGTLNPTPSFLFYGAGISEPAGASDARNAILGNSIHSNIHMGIEGDFINSSDRGHFPFLSSAISSNGILTVQGRLSTVGRLNTVTNALHRIEFFANDTIEPNGHGEGKIFLGATNVPTDSNGFVAFTAELPVAVSNGTFLTATATDDHNNTSEFSPRLTVGDVLTNVIVVNSVNDVDDGMANATHTSLREAILAANNHTGVDTIRFAIGSGARTISVTNSPPAIMDATILDATTQPGFAGKPLIYLDGLNTAPAGLRLYCASNTVRGFTINRFSYGIYSDGIYGQPMGRNIIEGNYLGTLPSGTATGGSVQQYGIYFTFGCASNRIGGTSIAARNLISGNDRAGVYMLASAGNLIQGNFIGTDFNGTNSLRNGVGVFGTPQGGVFMSQSQGAVIGGPEPGARNVISGNYGQLASDGSMLVENNFIAVDVTGTRALAFGGIGLELGNVISSVIRSNVTPALRLISSNLVEGNLIGTDATGTQALIGTFTGFLTGISISGSGNVVGGTNAAQRNVVAAQLDGIVVTGTDNTLQGNFVGTKADGVSPLGNVRDGIVVQASRNLIGGLEAGAGNIVAFNTNRGIAVTSGTGNAVLGNFIFANTGLGIDLGTAGVTTNDFGDFDSGANNLQNFPLLSAARNIGASTLIEGTLNSRSNISYRIEFFSNTNCHSSGSGQGRAFLNATTATTDPSGNATISFNHPVPIPEGQVITATATDPNNNTSEFSPCVTVINDTNYVVLSFSTSIPYTLSWPTSALSFSLERATNLTPPIIWQTISNGITTNGGSKAFVVTNDPPSSTMFFRLRKP